ncbi:MAG: helix-turn-helix transcriptional regulator [Hyphomonadaceae bacterium]
MDIRKRLGANLKHYREQAELSQEALADVAGLHRTYISGVERGVRNPTITVVEKIAKALKLKAWQLLE